MTREPSYDYSQLVDPAGTRGDSSGEREITKSFNGDFYLSTSESRPRFLSVEKSNHVRVHTYVPSRVILVADVVVA